MIIQKKIQLVVLVVDCNVKWQHQKISKNFHLAVGDIIFDVAAHKLVSHRFVMTWNVSSEHTHLRNMKQFHARTNSAYGLRPRLDAVYSDTGVFILHVYFTGHE